MNYHVSNGTIAVSERMGMSINAMIFFADTLDSFEKIQGSPSDKVVVLEQLKSLQSKLTNAISEQERLTASVTVSDIAANSAVGMTNVPPTIPTVTDAVSSATPTQPNITVPDEPTAPVPPSTPSAYVPPVPTTT